MLTKDETARLHRVIGQIAALRGHGVDGAWQVQRRAYRPVYIRRGPILIEGTNAGEPICVWVLSPADVVMIIPAQDAAGTAPTRPQVAQGCMVQVDTCEGPWWPIIRAELPKMEAELARAIAEHQVHERRSTVADGQRAFELRKAREACLAYLPAGKDGAA